MFLKLDEIAGKLDQIFLPLEQEGMTGMRLLPQKDALAFMQAQKSLGVNFPAKFTELLSKFDLGNFGNLQCQLWLQRRLRKRASVPKQRR